MSSLRIAGFVVTLGFAILASGCGKKDAEPNKGTNAISGNPLNVPAEYAGAVINAQQKAAKIVDMASVSQAIKLFQAAEGRYPTNLQELVTSGQMVQLPKTPRGMKYSYDAKKGQVSLVPE